MELHGRIQLLKKEIIYAFGRKIITSKDCIDLAESIYLKCSVKLSAHTLRRFFGLVKAEFYPSISTLNILSRYCGISSVDELKDDRPSRKNALITSADKMAQLMTTIFTDIDNIEPKDLFFLKLAHITIETLNRNVNLAEKFQKHIVIKSNASKLYFERFVNIDKLNFHYGNGLHLYLSTIREDTSKIFCHAIFCMRSWLNDNNYQLQLHYKQLKRVAIPPDTALSTYSHYYAALFYYMKAIDANTAQAALDAFDHYTQVKGVTQDQQALAYFSITVGEALMLTESYEDALVYINEVQKYLQNTVLDDIVSIKHVTLYKAIILLHLGHKMQAKILYNNIGVADFHFLKNQFQQLLYCLLARKLNKMRANESQIDFLIKATGFNRMRSFMNTNETLQIK